MGSLNVTSAVNPARVERPEAQAPTPATTPPLGAEREESSYEPSRRAPVAGVAQPYSAALTFPVTGLHHWLAKKVFGSDPGPKPTEKTQRYEPSAGDVDAVKKKYPDLEKGPPARSPEAAKAAYTMLARLNRMEREGRKLEVGGVTAEEVLRKTVIGNPKVSDDMLVKMGSRTLQQLVPGDKEREEIEARQPGSRELDSHKLAVAMLSAATGIDPSQLSKYGPDLGLSGTAGAPIGLRRPETTGDHLTTAMHDFTDTLKDAGITGMNDAVWGTDDKVFSALRSFAPLMSAREALDNIQNRMRNDWRTDDVLPFDMRQI